MLLFALLVLVIDNNKYEWNNLQVNNVNILRLSKYFVEQELPWAISRLTALAIVREGGDGYNGTLHYLRLGFGTRGHLERPMDSAMEIIFKKKLWVSFFLFLESAAGADRLGHFFKQYSAARFGWPYESTAFFKEITLHFAYVYLL